MRDREHDFIKIVPDYSLENKIIKETSHLDILKDFKFTREIREILHDSDEEKKRVKNFRPLFPAPSSLNYRKFFSEEKQINLILSLIEIDKCGDKDFIKKSKKINLINKIKNK